MAVSALEALTRLKTALADGGLETPPEGFKTASQWAQETGQSIAQTARVLRDGVTQGLAEEVGYRVRMGKVVRKIAHFRIKPAVPVSRKAKK